MSDKTVKLMGKIDLKSDKFSLNFILYERKGSVVCRMTWKKAEKEYTDERNFGNKSEKTYGFIDEWLNRVCSQIGIEYEDEWKVGNTTKKLRNLINGK